jgi:Na+/citrate or Na+/malate symporter
MTEASPLPRGWWRLVDMRMGIIPLPLFPLMLVLMARFVWLGKLPPELTMMIPLLALGAYVCAEIGKNIPILRNVGGAAIIATFLPSYLVYAHLLPVPVIKSVTDFAKQSNFLYLFICCIIVGSILGMQRDVLIKGFLKVFVPLFAGSVAAGIVGTAVGWARHPHVVLHRRAYHGRRCRRRCVTAIARLCHHHPPAAGHHLRHHSSRCNAWQPNGDHIRRRA